MAIVKSYKIYEMNSTTKVKINVMVYHQKTSLSLTSIEVTNLVFEYYYIAI